MSTPTSDATELSDAEIESAVPSDKPTYTPGQLYRMQAIYEFIARLIPTEGRDYSVDFTFSPDNPDNVGVRLVPHTPFGKTWCDHCMGELRRARTK